MERTEAPQSCPLRGHSMYHRPMKRSNLLSFFLLFLPAAALVWSQFGTAIGLIALILMTAVEIAVSADMERGRQESKRKELAFRRQIEEAGYTWEFYQEWRKSKEEIKRRESRRAARNAARRFCGLLSRPFSRCSSNR